MIKSNNNINTNISGHRINTKMTWKLLIIGNQALLISPYSINTNVDTVSTSSCNTIYQYSLMFVYKDGTKGEISFYCVQQFPRFILSKPIIFSQLIIDDVETHTVKIKYAVMNENKILSTSCTTTNNTDHVVVKEGESSSKMDDITKDKFNSTSSYLNKGDNIISECTNSPMKVDNIEKSSNVIDYNTHSSKSDNNKQSSNVDNSTQKLNFSSTLLQQTPIANQFVITDNTSSSLHDTQQVISNDAISSLSNKNNQQNISSEMSNDDNCEDINSLDTFKSYSFSRNNLDNLKRTNVIRLHSNNTQYIASDDSWDNNSISLNVHDNNNMSDVCSNNSFASIVCSNNSFESKIYSKDEDNPFTSNVYSKDEDNPFESKIHSKEEDNPFTSNVCSKNENNSFSLISQYDDDSCISSQHCKVDDSCISTSLCDDSCISTSHCDDDSYVLNLPSKTTDYKYDNFTFKIESNVPIPCFGVNNIIYIITCAIMYEECLNKNECVPNILFHLEDSDNKLISNYTKALTPRTIIFNSEHTDNNYLSKNDIFCVYDNIDTSKRIKIPKLQVVCSNTNIKCATFLTPIYNNNDQYSGTMNVILCIMFPSQYSDVNSLSLREVKLTSMIDNTYDEPLIISVNTSLYKVELNAIINVKFGNMLKLEIYDADTYYVEFIPILFVYSTNKCRQRRDPLRISSIHITPSKLTTLQDGGNNMDLEKMKQKKITTFKLGETFIGKITMIPINSGCGVKCEKSKVILINSDAEYDNNNTTLTFNTYLSDSILYSIQNTKTHYVTNYLM